MEPLNPLSSWHLACYFKGRRGKACADAAQREISSKEKGLTPPEFLFHRCSLLSVTEIETQQKGNKNNGSPSESEIPDTTFLHLSFTLA